MEQQETAQAPEETKAKTKRPRRVPELVAGVWDPKAPIFSACRTQPTGKAARKVDAFRAWLRQPATAKAFLEEGVSRVSCVRRELTEATYEPSTVVKASIS